LFINYYKGITTNEAFGSFFGERKGNGVKESDEARKSRIEAENKYRKYSWWHHLDTCVQSGWFNKPNMTPFQSVFYTPFQTLLEYLEIKHSVL